MISFKLRSFLKHTCHSPRSSKKKPIIISIPKQKLKVVCDLKSAVFKLRQRYNSCSEQKNHHRGIKSYLHAFINLSFRLLLTKTIDNFLAKKLEWPPTLKYQINVHLRQYSLEANWGHLRPFEANWGHLRQIKAIRVLEVIECLWGCLRPLEANRGHWRSMFIRYLRVHQIDFWDFLG